MADLASVDAKLVIARAEVAAAMAPPPPPPPPPSGGLPQSATFFALAPDPRGGDNGYNTFKRGPDGRGYIFGGFSHSINTNNAFVAYDPVNNSWVTLKPHTPWIDGPMVGAYMDVRGRTYFGNRDNHVTIMKGNEFQILHGERAIPMLGNYSCRFNTVTNALSIDDDYHFFGGQPAPYGGGNGPGSEFDYINCAGGWHPTLDKGYVLFGDQNGSPCAALIRYNADGTHQRWSDADPGTVPFPGAVKLRYISNSHFCRGNLVYVYGGSYMPWGSGTQVPGKTLYAIDIMAPTCTPVSVNNLPNGQRVEGFATFAYLDTAHDMLVATDGTLVNVYDFATQVWLNVPNTSPADPERTSYGAGFYSPEADGGIVLYRHAHLYKLKLNF